MLFCYHTVILCWCPFFDGARLQKLARLVWSQYPQALSIGSIRSQTGSKRIADALKTQGRWLVRPLLWTLVVSKITSHATSRFQACTPWKRKIIPERPNQQSLSIGSWRITEWINKNQRRCLLGLIDVHTLVYWLRSMLTTDAYRTQDNWTKSRVLNRCPQALSWIDKIADWIRKDRRRSEDSRTWWQVPDCWRCRHHVRTSLFVERPGQPMVTTSYRWLAHIGVQEARSHLDGCRRRKTLAALRRAQRGYPILASK